MKIGDKLICKVANENFTKGKVYKVNYIDRLTQRKFNVLDDSGDVFVLSIENDISNYSKYFYTLEEFIEYNNRERELRRIIDNIY
jgi:hypothetical protein